MRVRTTASARDRLRWSQRSTCFPLCAKPGEPPSADGARRATRPLQRSMCVFQAEHGKPSEACQGTWRGGRGSPQTQCRCPGEVADGASESACGKATDTRMRTDGEGPAPVGRWEQRSPAHARADHGECPVELEKCARTLHGFSLEIDRRC